MSKRGATMAVRLPFLPLSFRLDRRVPGALVALTLATLAVMVVNIGVGDYPIAPLDVLRTVVGAPDATAEYGFIVNTLRLPRMLVAALVGLALGISGTIMQGLTRNALADPDILGISAGAGLVAVTLLVVVQNVGGAALSLAAFGGALLVAALIYLLAWRRGDSPLRLLLIGIALGAVASALTTIMLTYGDTYDVQRALIWLSGSVYARTWKEFWALLPWVAVFAPLSLLMARHLNAFHLGEDVARGLGARLAWYRGLLLLAAVALAGSSVAAAGTIGFVGLMAPHIGRRLVGPDHTGLIPTAGAIGALIVVAADLAGRALSGPNELPCGLITAAIGAPFFLYLLISGGARSSK
jgi:iron complex transport system permease protein